MNFEVTILGSGAAIPTLRRNPTSQYVVCNDRHLLIDCGEGTQLQIRKYGIKLQRITHILISHMHGDHFFGLVGVISTMHLLGRDKNLTIYGPPELEQIVVMQLDAGGNKLNFDIEFVALNGNESCMIFEDRMIEIHTFPLKHRIPTNGYLIKEKPRERNLIADAIHDSGLRMEDYPKLKRGEDVVHEDGTVYECEDYTFPPKPSFSYAYCSDTMYYESVIPHIQGASVLYHEATFLNAESDRAKATFHSTAEQAAKIAQKANVGRLLLGHLSARYENGDKHEEEARPFFENVHYVNDGEVFAVLS